MHITVPLIYNKGMSKKIKLLSISNGHGEDLIAMTIISALRSRYNNVEIDAYPMVGMGKSYSNGGVPIVTLENKQFPSGGFIYNSSDNMMKDVSSGVVQFTFNQFKHIRKIAPEYNGALIVGDVVPLMLAWWGKLDFVFYGSAKSEYDNNDLLKAINPVYTGMERKVMKSKYCRIAAFRDRITTERMGKYIGEKSVYLGNPMMDIEIGSKLQLDKPIVALLPGSRDDAALNLEDMLTTTFTASQSLPQYEYFAAVTPSLSNEAIAEIGLSKGYGVLLDNSKGADIVLQKGNCFVYFSKDSFGQIISSCVAAIGLAGTANEQTVGLGKPLVSFITRGMQYQERFARSQHNILGDSVSVNATPEKAAEKLIEILSDKILYTHMADIGKTRMGEPGGSERLAKAIVEQFQNE